MQVTVRQEGGVGILDVDGYINSEGGEQVAQTCQRLMGEDVRKFLIISIDAASSTALASVS